MEHSSSREANNSSASQEITRILWNPKFRKCAHNSKPHFPILSHINPVHASITYYLKDSLTLPSLRLGLSSAHIPSSFPTKTLYASLFPPYVSQAKPTSFYLECYHQMIYGEGSRLCTSDGRSLHKSGLLEAVVIKDTPLDDVKFMGVWRVSSTNF